MMVCERCGLEWRVIDAAPGCEPITYDRMRLAMLDVVAMYERSHRIISEIRADGGAANPATARRRMTELQMVLRLVERVGSSPDLKAAVSGKARPARS